ncbi:MAG: addiction module protein [Planctomycetales bacterium]|nr:addiction module protein [Planctomycetales bacterium]
MSTSDDPLIESALALPQAQRADLALQLLQSLDPPGDEIAADEFGQQLRQRIEEYRRGEIASSTLDEARAAIERNLSEGSGS